MTDAFFVTVNDTPHRIDCSPGTSLLTALHEQGYRGVHRVCESGDCGSCTVWVDGEAVHSCIYPARRAEGRSLTTIEGLENGALSPMQQAFLQHQGFQCGYCTPGMIMSAEKMSGTTEAEIRQQMDGNLCRCTGYQAIVESMVAGKQGCIADVPAVVHQVGENVPKQDGPDIVTGKPVYTADYTPPGLLHLKLLRSPHAHARIRSIDTSKAEALPGVQLVLTYKDVERRAYSTAGHGEPVPDPLDHYLLDNKVRFVGDRVAAVVADSVAIATAACELIEVEYDILPHVVDPIVAMGDRATDLFPDIAPAPVPVIHDEPDSSQITDAAHNIAGEVRLGKGDVEAGFAEADIITERTYTLPAVQHFHLEPHISTSWLEADGSLTVRSSTQVPFHCQRVLSELFDLPRDRIRVFKAKLGGGFGNKQEILTDDLCALATLRTGRPVQWQFTRQEEFIATTSRHATHITLKIGMKQDGTLTAMDMTAIANTGAYGNHGTQVVFLTGSMPLGLYRCPNQRFVGRSVYTNTMPAGAFRGYGATQGVFAVECQMDEMAQLVGMDSLELRRRQLINPSDEILLGSDHHFHLVGSCGLEDAVKTVMQRLDYSHSMKPVINGTKRRGTGFAIAMQGSGLAKIHLAKVKLSLKPDGQYELRTGSVDVGTGSDTTLRQIIADRLGVTVDAIALYASDTKETPFDAGSYASATLYISGKACLLAAEAMRSHLLTLGSQLLAVPVEQLSLSASGITDGTQTLSLAKLAERAIAQGESLTIEREHAADTSTLTFAVQGVEVEVDMETGKVTVLRCVQVLDIGKAINPRICEGQAVGGTVMGLGYALQEELQRDADGCTLNPHPRTYRIPLAKEVPPIEIQFIENADPYGPLGAKGIGEIGTNCTAPAVANAIAHATGVRLRQLPMTPERVWRALREAEHGA
jgi:probable selenate reductase molybdenum-binding subunit